MNSRGLGWILLFPTLVILFFFGVLLWVAVACVIVYNLFSYESEIEYTFHGHPIDVTELEKEDN